MATDDTVGDPVQPHERVVSLRNVVDPTPHDEEDLRNRVVDEITDEPPATVIADLPMVAGIQVRELSVFAHEPLGWRTVAHANSMPDRRRGLRGTSA